MPEVRYTPVAHDGPHTMEQQLLLLAKAAHRAWEIWCGPCGGRASELQGVNPDFDNAMRNIYAQCYQTDVFMGGVDHSRK